ncbi:MAG TPA: sensor histidine kinase [Lutibacter sp.]|nr:sensor histidine kinase [Arcobacter sp.]HIP49216.1 sensor histidine kinase [Lutibacter sp.]
MTEIDIYKIRPAARILRTIGQDLIKDIHAAIIELVKNSYDADANNSYITLEYIQSKNTLSITVADDGHGMSLNTITDVWLVPATSNKKDKKLSPNGRAFQGRKGIGRYAVGILGSAMLMEAVDSNLNKSSVVLDFNEIEKSEFLSDIDIVIKQSKGKDSGVRIVSSTYNIKEEEVVSLWNNKQLQKLKLELQKLQSPIIKDTNDKFNIFLEFINFPKCTKGCHKEYSKRTIINYSIKEKIEPLPIIDFYDYRVYGSIDSSGSAKLFYENQNMNIKPIAINQQIELGEDSSYCGDVEIDLRVFDRDTEAITDLLNRGLKEYNVGKLEARKLLDSVYGVGIYRGGFRIRPYGDKSYDWLDLDKRRVQNPSYNIGMNQIVGFISIENEEQSNLQEKSARDGLVENAFYNGLVSICNDILMNQLQKRRFDFRQQTNRGRKTVNIEDSLDSLFDLSTLKNKVKEKLVKEGVPEVVSTSITKMIDSEKKSKVRDLENIKHTIAIYQGQVTLGKLTDVLLHEGRKSLRYINEQTPRINKWLKKFAQEPNSELSDKILDRSNSVISHSKALSNLFKRIEPLSRSRLPNRKKTNIYSSVNKAAEIFETSLESNQINFINDIDKNLVIYGREFDLITAFSNFIENSIFWLINDKDEKVRVIKITSEEDDKHIIIEFFDNGPGIDKSFVHRVFDPGFTLKDGGTGLGMSIAAESLKRSFAKVSIMESNDGTVLHIEFLKRNMNG